MKLFSGTRNVGNSNQVPRRLTTPHKPRNKAPLLSSRERISTLPSAAVAALIITAATFGFASPAQAVMRLASPNTASLSHGLVGYWPLDGSVTNWATGRTGDLSGHYATGTMQSMTSANAVAGKIGGALKFNSTQSQVVDAGPISALDAASQATLCGWVYQISSTNHVGLGAASTDSYRFDVLWMNDTYIYFEAGNGSTDQYYYASLTGSGWHHVCNVFNGSLSGNARVAGYIDGRALSLSYPVTPPATLASGANMGRFYMGWEVAHSYSTGIIDDVRIYNRALSDSEVKQLYNLGTANIAHSNTVALSNGLVGYWTFDGAVTDGSLMPVRKECSAPPILLWADIR